MRGLLGDYWRLLEMSDVGPTDDDLDFGLFMIVAEP